MFQKKTRLILQMLLKRTFVNEKRIERLKKKKKKKKKKNRNSVTDHSLIQKKSVSSSPR